MSTLFAAFSEKSVLSDMHLSQRIQKTRPLAVLSSDKGELS